MANNTNSTTSPGTAAQALPQKPETLDDIKISAAIEVANNYVPGGVTLDMLLSDAALGVRNKTFGDTNYRIQCHNAMVAAAERHKCVSGLSSQQVGEFLVRLKDRFVVVTMPGGTKMLYCRAWSGEDTECWMQQHPGGGTEPPSFELMFLARKLMPGITRSQIRELYDYIVSHELVARKRWEDVRNDLIWLRNGVYDLTKQLFVPYGSQLYHDEYAGILHLFVWRANYNPLATTPPVFTNKAGETWDSVGAYREPFEILGATKEHIDLMEQGIWEMYFFALTQRFSGYGVILANGNSGGANAKGTVTRALEVLIGSEHILTVPFEKLSGSDPHALDGIERAAAIIAAESDMANGIKLGSTTALKSLTHHSPVAVRPLYRPAYSYLFNGICIQSINGSLSGLGNRDDSAWRNLLIFRFERNFRAEGKENPEIMEKFMVSKEFLEYVVYRVCHMSADLERFSSEVVAEAEAGKTALRSESSQCAMFFADAKTWLDAWLHLTQRGIANRGWKPEEINRFVIPTKMLFDACTNWCKDNGYEHYAPGIATFRMELISWAASNPDWDYISHEKTTRTPRVNNAYQFAYTYSNESIIGFIRHYAIEDKWLREPVFRWHVAWPTVFAGGLKYAGAPIDLTPHDDCAEEEEA